MTGWKKKTTFFLTLIEFYFQNKQKTEKSNSKFLQNQYE